jgi:hypothetical protein
MHILVAIGYDIPRPHNAELMQWVLEDKHVFAIKVGLGAGHIFLVFWQWLGHCLYCKGKQKQFSVFVFHHCLYFIFSTEK